MSIFPATASDPAAQQNFDKLSELIYTGNGSPENVVPARIGAIYLRQDGGATTTLYVKTADDTKPSGWTAK